MIYVYGIHSVEEALRSAPGTVVKLFFGDTFQNDELKTLARSNSIRIESITPKVERKLPEDATHQGVVAEVDTEKLIMGFSEFLNTLSISPNTCLLLLGEIQDIQNVGALIRSAAAFGVAGVLIPDRNQAPITGAVAKVSAGMIFKVPLVHVGNVNTAIRELKDKGFWVYGLDVDAETLLQDEGFEKPTVLILGNEAKGIRAKTLEYCDITLKIPMKEGTESLNVAASGAVALYAWSVRHPRT
jgi:23S rRNA (guanosine2251-2'-O)-methyltransferase